MQTLTLTIQDDFMPIFMKFISGFNSHEIQIEERFFKDTAQPTRKKRDLSKLVPHENVINGNPEDLVNMNWEHELNVNFPN